jgi:very-short-patch-repair endonuclease
MPGGVIHYRKGLKAAGRSLRRNLTEAEQLLWGRVRMKQILRVQFFRQRPLGNFIVDFFAPRAKLVVEVDGSQHLTDSGINQDPKKEEYLNRKGFLVLHFNNSEVLKRTESVMEVIFREVLERVTPEIPPLPPLEKGG